MRPRRSRALLSTAALAILGLTGAACRSSRIVSSAPDSVTSAEVEEFSSLVDDLTRIGSHGAIDPKKEREAGR